MIVLLIIIFSDSVINDVNFHIYFFRSILIIHSISVIDMNDDISVGFSFVYGGQHQRHLVYASV